MIYLDIDVYYLNNQTGFTEKERYSFNDFIKLERPLFCLEQSVKEYRKKCSNFLRYEINLRDTDSNIMCYKLKHDNFRLFMSYDAMNNIPTPISIGLIDKEKNIRVEYINNNLLITAL